MEQRLIRYLNTDLDLEAAFDLSPLAEALAARGLLVLHVRRWESGSWSARLETAVPFTDPDANLQALLSAVETLEGPLRSQWAACTVRAFDMGYDSGHEPRNFYRQLTPATLGRMAALNATLVITIYPPEPDESDNGNLST
ncbi:hypothetical protein [Larkinella soli]|uniref:hypothetical protein n=1 Tax=Larkinella soli TaxID=1770527 RepID=UPI000FFBAB00|nr:hypothetical protein [Larkinella soli]